MILFYDLGWQPNQSGPQVYVPSFTASGLGLNSAHESTGQTPNLAIYLGSDRADSVDATSVLGWWFIAGYGIADFV